MESELSRNTPIFDKDPKYCECEECHGEGKHYTCDEHGNQIIPEMCLNCNGDGQIEIED